MLRGTEEWDSVSSVIPLAEKIIGRIVNTIHAGNGKKSLG